MPEIIVTAEKRSSSVNKVPLSMNVFNGTQLATAGVHSTEDLAKVVPGFSTVTSFYGAPVYYLRGVGFYDNSVAARPAVTIYADEAPIPYSVMAMGTTLDLERVELLKGRRNTHSLEFHRRRDQLHRRQARQDVGGRRRCQLRPF
jgi:hypothetical protein